MSVPASVTAAGYGGGSIGLPILKANRSIAANPFPQFAGAAGGGFFGKVGNSLAGAAPFLGASVGGSLGGQSIFGQIAGSAGGLLLGGAIGAATTTGVFSAGATALLTNPFTIAAGAGLLIGSYFLGKAKQRRSDEETSGQYLTQALQAIDQLALGVGNGSIDGGQARQIFDTQILGAFKTQISQLKTKSVVQSRLTNQVRDLQKVYDARIPPLIAEQERQAAQEAQRAADARRFAGIDARLIPQFAGGGYVGGIDRGFDSVKALLRPGELVLNRGQQAAVIAQSSPSVFRNAGVPAFNTTGRYADGGYVSGGGGQGGQAITIQELVIDAVVDAQGIYVVGATSANGQKIDIKNVRERRLNREG
jgi:hypothetical protein